MTGVTLVKLPWPPTQTSPNAKSPGNWRKKSKAGKSYKATCAKECAAQYIRHMDWDGQDIPVEIIYYPPSLRRIDWDNLANRCKQGFDAVAEAVGVDDSHWWPVTSIKGNKVAGGAVIVRICND